MKKILLVAVAVLVALPVAIAQNPPTPPLPGNLGAAPAFAFDITKADVDAALNNSPGVDHQIRIVDMGKYNLAVAVIQRGPTHDKPGDPIPVLYHDYTAETYIILSGEGVLTTGGVIENRKADSGVPPVANGPGGRGTAGQGAYSRKVRAGDIILIPTGVAHGWSQVTDHVTYLSVRPDPDRVLPAGYVNPALLKNQPEEIKAPPAPDRQPQGR